jgi:hypothetical protein
VQRTRARHRRPTQRQRQDSRIGLAGFPEQRGTLAPRSRLPTLRVARAAPRLWRCFGATSPTPTPPPATPRRTAATSQNRPPNVASEPLTMALGARATAAADVSIRCDANVVDCARMPSRRLRRCGEALPRARLLRGMRCPDGRQHDLLRSVRAVSAAATDLGARCRRGRGVCAAAVDRHPSDEVWSAHRPGRQAERAAASRWAALGCARDTGSTSSGAVGRARLQRAGLDGAAMVSCDRRRVRALGARALARDTASIEAVGSGASAQRARCVRRAPGRRRASRDPAR